jgi:hypothetical protein
LQEALRIPFTLWLYIRIACHQLFSCQSFSFLFLFGLKIWGGFTMSSKSTGKFQTPGALYREFLKAVIFDVNSAIGLVGEAAFPDGLESQPSPEVEVLMKAGEWDSKEKVQMVGCMRMTCKARIGAGGEPVRFCFNRNYESIPSLLGDKNKLALEDGWYVRSSSQDKQGAHVTRHLPTAAVPANVRFIFTRTARPLKMVVGVWRLLCQDYHDGVAAAARAFSEGDYPSDADPLELDTKPAAETRKPPQAKTLASGQLQKRKRVTRPAYQVFSTLRRTLGGFSWRPPRFTVTLRRVFSMID